MRKTKKKSLFPWKRPQSRCHCVPCYSSVRAGLRNRQKALLMRWTVQIPPSPVKTSTLAIPKGICRDVFFCSKEKGWNPRVALKMRKTKKKSLFPWKRPQSRCHCVPCYSSVRAGLRNRQKALLMRWTVQIPPSPVKTSTLAIPKGICRDVFFLFKKKKDGTRVPLKSICHIESPQNRTFILRAFLIIPLFHTPFLRCSTPLPYILPVPLPLSADRSILPANSHMFRQ